MRIDGAKRQFVFSLSFWNRGASLSLRGAAEDSGNRLRLDEGWDLKWRRDVATVEGTDFVLMVVTLTRCRGFC
ncbi:hypothetical protein CEXT_180651 [Caerostris extrusa]|uniref:Uncharacterized protein n=1 Tax=Caerostris extrusa TaxID=172846 RepID=A0AAV4XGA6_CAEEX|nr:hypothetical protein CEXT_180651 [Caerostris extrusa]